MARMKRGDIIVAAPPGDYGKPRPSVIVQSDAFAPASFTVLPFSSDLQDENLLRITVMPSAANGLRKPCQVMVDKIVTMAPAKIGQKIGRLEDDRMAEVNQALGRFLGLEGA